MTAIDVAKLGDFDWLPRIKAMLGPDEERTSNFELARRMRGSRVGRKVVSVYDLSPDTVGTFDVVFCGDVLLHLFNPLQALIKIFSVTGEMAVVFTTVDVEIERLEIAKPWLSFGFRRFETIVGDHNTYWLFSTKALREMMEYAGFAVTIPQPQFHIPPHGLATTSVIGFRDAAAAERAGFAPPVDQPARTMDALPPENLSREESTAWLIENLRRERLERAAVDEWRDNLYKSRLWQAAQAYRRAGRAVRRLFGGGG